jgi:hypothetical protein
VPELLGKLNADILFTEEVAALARKELPRVVAREETALSHQQVQDLVAGYGSDGSHTRLRRVEVLASVPLSASEMLT